LPEAGGLFDQSPRTIKRLKMFFNARSIVREDEEKKNKARQSLKTGKK
jgi:hypothetical protein